jgi:hypothetical protein
MFQLQQITDPVFSVMTVRKQKEQVYRRYARILPYQTL